MSVIPTRVRSVTRPFIAFSLWCHLCNQEDFLRDASSAYASNWMLQMSKAHVAASTRRVARPGHDRREDDNGTRNMSSAGAGAGAACALRCAAVVQLFHGEQLAFEKVTRRRVLTGEFFPPRCRMTVRPCVLDSARRATVSVNATLLASRLLELASFGGTSSRPGTASSGSGRRAGESSKGPGAAEAAPGEPAAISRVHIDYSGS
jgi:hypothetical protein